MYVQLTPQASLHAELLLGQEVVSRYEPPSEPTAVAGAPVPR